MSFSNLPLSPDDLPGSAEIGYHSLAKVYPRINSVVTGAFFTLVLIVFETVTWLAGAPLFVRLIGLVVGVTLILVFTRFAWLSAKVRRYAVRERDVLFESGVYWRTQTIQPLDRIQHVELARGPLDKRYDLAKLQLFSSGSNSATFVIPALPLERAEQLREFVLSHRQDT